jgi:hypothetical protein
VMSPPDAVVADQAAAMGGYIRASALDSWCQTWRAQTGRRRRANPAPGHAQQARARTCGQQRRVPPRRSKLFVSVVLEFGVFPITGFHKCEDHIPLHPVHHRSASFQQPCLAKLVVAKARRARTAQHADTLQPYYTYLKACRRPSSREGLR